MKSPQQQVEDSIRTIREEFDNHLLGNHDVTLYDDRAIVDTKVSAECNHQRVTWVIYGEDLSHPQISGLILEAEL